MDLNLFTALSAQATPDMGFAGLVTVTGMSIVFIVLIVLVLIFDVFGRIMARGTKEKKEKPVKAAPKAAASPAVTAAPAPAANGVSPEIVAVIAAALAQYGEKGVIRSVRPAVRRGGRNPWAVAGIMENTRQF